MVRPLSPKPVSLGCSLALALVCALPGDADAGAWTRPLGGLYVKAGATYFMATGANVLSGRIRQSATFASERYEVYGEVGLGGGFQLELSLPLLRNHNRFGRGGSATRSGLGDLAIGLAWGLRRAAWAVAFRAAPRIPLYTRVDLSAGGLPEEPELGDGKPDLDLVLLVGRSLYPLPAWVEISVGQRLRLSHYAGAVMLSAKAGGFLGNLMLTGELRLMRGFGVGDDPIGKPRPTHVLTVEPKAAFFIVSGLAVELQLTFDLPGASRDPGIALGGGLMFQR